MSSIETSKPHVVCVACPAQGHLTPMMQIARVLHSRGFHITLVNTEFNHNRLVRSQGADSFKGLTNFQFETIPDGLPPSDRDATQDLPTLCEALRTNCLSPFLELLNRLNSSSETPPVTCIVADGLMSFAIKAAEALGIPEFQLWTASASAFMGYIHFSELLKRGIVPFKNENFQSDGTLDTPIDWIPGVRNIRLRDMPSFMRVNDADDIMFDFMGSEAQNSLKATGGIIFNTFDELEHEVLEAIAAKLPRIYKTGPLLMLARHIPSNCPSKSISSSLWKEDTNCIEWLNKREPGSVVYVNFGSIVMMSEQHLKEFAWGLANCKHPFLWIVRPDVVRGEYAALPEEFLEEIKDRGLISSWCAQNQVLCHPSVGVFLTHCGWNSVLEAISGGVPLICWPSFGDQPTHCRYAYTSWGIGLEADQDVKRENIESLVREMMEGEKGKEIKGKALEWKKKAEAASDVGGSSYNDFDRFVKEALCHG